MKRRAWKLALAVAMLTGASPGILFAFDGGGSASGLFGDLDTRGLTKKDLRREKRQQERWQPQEAVETGTLESTRDVTPSPSTETDDTKDRSIDAWP